jgi:hypothetical protein
LDVVDVGFPTCYVNHSPPHTIPSINVFLPLDLEIGPASSCTFDLKDFVTMPTFWELEANLVYELCRNSPYLANLRAENQFKKSDLDSIEMAFDVPALLIDK